MKKVKVLVLMLLSVILLTGLVGCRGKEDNTTFEDKVVREVIGSTSTSGDTYMTAEISMRYLTDELGWNGKVDAVGAGPAFEALATAEADGSTLFYFHDMAYLGVTFGAFDEKYKLENMIVGPAVARNGTSAFLASDDAPYNDFVELAEYLVDNPDEYSRFAIESGGVSHIGFVAYYMWVQETYGEDVATRLVAIPSGSTSEKSQMLWDGNCDVIFADYSSTVAYTEDGVDDQIKMKYLALLDNVEGLDLPSYADQGITYNGEPFRFSKEFVIYLPLDTPQELIDELDAAAEAINNNDEYKTAMSDLFFSPTYRSSEENKKYMYDKRESLGSLIESAPSFDELTEY